MSGGRAIAPGAEMPPFVDSPLTSTDFVRYQGASGDMNPIHHDAEFAQRAGFPSVFAPGMLAAGIAASRLADWLGAENVRRFRAQFREQAWPGDVLTYQARVVADREEDGDRLLDVEFTVEREDGAPHIRGWATYVAR